MLIQEVQHKRTIEKKSHFIPIVAYIHYSLCIGFSNNVLISERHLQVYKHNKIQNSSSIVSKQ